MIDTLQHEIYEGSLIREINIIMHGFDSSMNSTSVSLLFERLKLQQRNVFRFSFMGHGSSIGKLEDTTLDSQIEDLKNVINFLKKKGYEKFNLFGSSFSGQVSLFVAEAEDCVKKIFLKCPLLDGYTHFFDLLGKNKINKIYATNSYIYERHNGQKINLKSNFIESFKNHRFLNLKKVFDKKIVLVHGLNDVVVPLGHVQKLIERLPDENVLILKNSGHRIQGPELELLIEFYLKFLN